MLKFLIIPIVGLLLTAGTFFYESNVIDKCVESGINSVTDCLGEVRGRGFPVEYVREIGSTFDFTPDEKANGVFQAQDTQIDNASLIQNYVFWVIAAGIGYFIFRKIRNMVGTVVLVGLGVAAGLVYFGILVL